jgi:hypothetical protein
LQYREQDADPQLLVFVQRIDRASEEKSLKTSDAAYLGQVQGSLQFQVCRGLLGGQPWAITLPISDHHDGGFGDSEDVDDLCAEHRCSHSRLPPTHPRSAVSFAPFRMSLSPVV